MRGLELLWDGDGSRIWAVSGAELLRGGKCVSSCVENDGKICLKARKLRGLR